MGVNRVISANIFEYFGHDLQDLSQMIAIYGTKSLPVDNVDS